MTAVRVTNPREAAAGIDRGLGIVDLHVHPSMMAYMFGTRFWKAHRPPLWFCPWSMRVDIDALIAGGVKTFVCTSYALERDMYADVWPLRFLATWYPRAKYLGSTPVNVLTRECLDCADAMIEETRRRRGDIVAVARSYAEMQEITGSGRVCMLHAIEGAHHLDGDIDMVDELRARGVCLMILPHLYPNAAGGCVNVFSKYRIPAKCGCFLPKYQDASGLTDWGHQLVEKLLEVGILVDPTHGTREYRAQVLDIVRRYPKKRPMLMSHACLAGEGTTEFGPDPDEIKAIADTGGVVGIMMYTHREGSQSPTLGVEYVIKSIDYLIRHGGEEVVAIGSDFDGTSDVSKDLRSPRAYAGVREAVLRKYSETQTRKFFSGNAERVLKDGWGA